MVVSTVIPSSLSYSSCCSSSTASTSLTNVGTVSVPIQVIKTQKSNNNTNSTSTTTTTTTASGASIESQKGYRYTPKQSQPRRLVLNLKAGKRIEPLPILSVSLKRTFSFASIFFLCTFFLLASFFSFYKSSLNMYIETWKLRQFRDAHTHPGLFPSTTTVDISFFFLQIVAKEQHDNG